MLKNAALLVAALTLALPALADNPQDTTNKSTQTAATPGFGPQQVWRPPQAAMAELYKCTDPMTLNCVHKVMKEYGVSAEAFEFYHLTGWFLLELKDTGGPVMLASVANPWRANENEQPALVGGHRLIVYPEDVRVPVEADAGFKALEVNFPQLLFWKSGPTLETYAVTETGERFVFRYKLLDGCHACAIRGWARIEFAFGSDGSYQRAKLLDVVPK